MNDKERRVNDLLESMQANQRAINTQVASEYSFDELMKELKNA